jgi:hypothetical protein
VTGLPLAKKNWLEGEEMVTGAIDHVYSVTAKKGWVLVLAWLGAKT